jgi:1-pyrroline-4-hydroxy-2-carboxylate deaminase
VVGPVVRLVVAAVAALDLHGRVVDALDLYRWFTPVLHLDCHPKLVQYIKLAQAMCGHGTEDCRAPRLPLVGEERKRIAGLIQQTIDTRAALAA